MSTNAKPMPASNIQDQTLCANQPAPPPPRGEECNAPWRLRGPADKSIALDRLRQPQRVGYIATGEGPEDLAR